MKGVVVSPQTRAGRPATLDLRGAKPLTSRKF